MNALRRYRPRHATVVAYLALFIALGGTSYAVATGSIGSPQIKDNSVRSKDIRNNEVRSKDVKDGSLVAADFDDARLPRGRPGRQGRTGPAGPAVAGPQGAQGPAGVSGLERVRTDSAANSDSPKLVVATCPAGKRVIGTGANITGAKNGATSTSFVTDVVIDSIIPSPETTVPGSVTVNALEEQATNDNWSITAYAMCVSVP